MVGKSREPDKYFFVLNSRNAIANDLGSLCRDSRQNRCPNLDQAATSGFTWYLFLGEQSTHLQELLSALLLDCV